MRAVICAMALAAMPAAAILFLGFGREGGLKRAAARWAAAAALSGALALAAWKLAGSGRTIYEFVYVSSLSALTAALAVGIAADRKRADAGALMRAVCYVAVATAFYSILTAGRAGINSDTATATLLIRSRVRHHSLFPKTWNYANGEIWAGPDVTTLAYPFVLLMKNQPLARALASAVYILAVLAGMVYQSRSLFKSDMWLLSIPLFLVFAGGQNEVTLYQGAYVIHMLTMTAGIALFYAAVFRRKPVCALLYALLAFCKSVSGIRFIAEQSLPLIGACLILALVQPSDGADGPRRGKAGRLAYSVLLGALPAIAGYWAYKGLCAWHNVNDTTNNAMVFIGSLSGFPENLKAYFVNLVECFGFTGGVGFLTSNGLRNFISLFGCLMICFVLPALQGKRIAREGEEVRLFYAFGILHNLIMLVMVVFGGLLDARYLLSSVYVCILISSRYVWAVWTRWRPAHKRVWLAALAAATAIECLVMVHAGAGWSDRVAKRQQFNEKLIERGLTKGYATYWNAYGNELYSNGRLRYGGVTVTDRYVRPWRWLVDSEVYEPIDGRTFLLLDAAEEQTLSSELDAILGEPEESFKQDGLRVYVFDHDIAVDFGAEGVYRAAEFFYNENGAFEGREIVLGQGGIAYGPYVGLEPGQYTVVIHGENMGDCWYDVFSAAGQSAIEYVQTDRTDGEIRLILKADRKISDLEFRIRNDRGGHAVKLNRVEVRKENP